MKLPKIGITGMGSISPLGHLPDEIWENYLTSESLIRRKEQREFIASISDGTEEALIALKKENKYYSKTDRSVQLAILAARRAVAQAGWKSKDNFGINLSSSRGATQSFEDFHSEYQKEVPPKTSVLASPMTTLGNLATWVAHDLGTNGPNISHSITCSSAGHAILNALAWLRSGMSDQFLIGGTEAPLTDFTLAQMKALKIYQKGEEDLAFPCRSLDLEKNVNTMVLGEGAACFCLEKNPEQALAYICGAGFYTESFQHPTQISKEGYGFQKAMEQALAGLDKNTIDAVILHAPGTIQGDRGEYSALETIFDQKMPRLTTNKWKIGHTLGASAALSLELALLMLQRNIFIPIPYLENDLSEANSLQRIMVNSMGFGGNAVSIILEKSELVNGAVE